MDLRRITLMLVFSLLVAGKGGHAYIADRGGSINDINSHGWSDFSNRIDDMQPGWQYEVPVDGSSFNEEEITWDELDIIDDYTSPSLFSSDRQQPMGPWDGRDTPNADTVKPPIIRERRRNSSGTLTNPNTCTIRPIVLGVRFHGCLPAVIPAYGCYCTCNSYSLPVASDDTDTDSYTNQLCSCSTEVSFDMLPFKVRCRSGPVTKHIGILRECACSARRCH
ncbi:uncharacterized protein LOC144348118 [Saccoglossus kowalevskii]